MRCTLKFMRWWPLMLAARLCGYWQAANAQEKSGRISLAQKVIG